jgi:hypothetical protein
MAYCEEMGVPWKAHLMDTTCRISLKASNALWVVAMYSHHMYRQEIEQNGIG